LQWPMGNGYDHKSSGWASFFPSYMWLNFVSMGECTHFDHQSNLVFVLPCFIYLVCQNMKDALWHCEKEIFQFLF
jgi:hypothetical protein